MTKEEELELLRYMILSNNVIERAVKKIKVKKIAKKLKDF